VVYLAGLAAALSLGFGYVLQQRVAATMPLEELLRWRLLFHLMRRRLWWAGVAAMVVGQVLAGLALQLASVAVVEPLLSTNLLFALAFAAMFARARARWQEIVGACVLSASLGVLIAVGNPKNSHEPTSNSVRIALAVIVVGLGALLLGAAARRRGLVGESILLATGAGLTFGLQDASTRASFVDIDDHGVRALPTSPWPYLVVACAVVGILLSQSAFKAARLDYSLPPIAAAEPVTGILLGIWLLGDAVSVTIPGLIVESACLASMIAGAGLIAHSPNLGSTSAPAGRNAPPSG
jgi:drug/metabolite transporter (DMT)-like permease